MDFSFASKKVRHLCESESKASQFFGEAVSKKLKSRLSDIEAASNLSEVKAGSPERLDGGKSGKVTINLCEGYKIILSCSNTLTKIPEPELIDWKKITRIIILNIEKHV